MDFKWKLLVIRIALLLSDNLLNGPIGYYVKNKRKNQLSENYFNLIHSYNLLCRKSNVTNGGLSTPLFKKVSWTIVLKQLKLKDQDDLTSI